MKTETLVIALLATLLAGPATTYAQIEIDALESGTSELLGTEATLTLPGVAGEHAARVVAPRNFSEQIRGGTLRELELEVPRGPMSEAFSRAHRSRRALASLSLKAQQPGSAYLVVELKNARVTSYSVSAAADADKYARVKVRFASPPASQSSAGGAPVPGIEGSPIGTAGAPQQPG